MAGGGLVLHKRNAAEVDEAPTGKVRLFVDEDGHLSAVDEDGTIVSPEASIATLEALVATKQNASTAATDSELASAVTTLTAAINAKQDSSSAATDAELAAAVSTLNVAIAAKQDAVTAATDAELASEKSAREAADVAEKAEREAADDELTAGLETKQAAATAATDAELAAGLAAKQSTSEKGQANGYPSLDGSGHVPPAQMPVGALTYKGTWNATTNTPVLTDGSGTVGEQYAITVGGTRNLGSGSIEFLAGSVLQHNGSVWQQISSPDAVASVFGRKGAVVAQSGDYAVAEIAGLTAALAGKQPFDEDLAAIAALATTSFGRSLLALVNAAAARTVLELGSAATKDAGAAGASGKVLNADDATTVDARTPKAHAAAHADGGVDELEISASQVTGLGTAAVAAVAVDVPGFTDARLEFMKNNGIGVRLYGEDVNMSRLNNCLINLWIGKLGFDPVNRQSNDVVVQD